jgi:hypothetical protein
MQGSAGCLLVGQSTLLDGAPAAANSAIQATQQFDTCMGQGGGEAGCTGASAGNGCPSTPVAQTPSRACLTPDWEEVCDDPDDAYKSCVAEAEQVTHNYTKCEDIFSRCSQGLKPCGATSS